MLCCVLRQCSDINYILGIDRAINAMAAALGITNARLELAGVEAERWLYARRTLPRNYVPLRCVATEYLW